MLFTIRHFLAMPSMKHALLIAGKDGLDNEITNIMVMEAADICGWAKQGYLLLTSFYAMKDFSNNEIQDVIKKLSECKCSGLIVKMDRLIKNIPATIVKACEENNMPLIQIPKELAYSEIQVEVMQKLFNKKVELLDYYYNMHSYFTNFYQTHPSIPEVLQYLSEIIKTPCALLNHHKNIMYCTDERLKKIVTVGNVNKHKKILFETEISDVQIGEQQTHKQLLIKIPLINNKKRYYLIIVDVKGVLSDKDYIAIENAVSFLQMLLVQRIAVFNIKEHYLNDVMDDLLEEKFDCDENLNELTSKLKIKPCCDEFYHVVTIYFSLGKDSSINLKTIFADFVDNIKFIWEGSTYRLREKRLILLLPSLGLTPEEVKNKLDNDIKNILHSITVENITYKAGISDPAKINSLSKPLEQSGVIVKKVMEQGEKSFVANSDDIGFYKFFTSISKDVELVNLVPERLIFLKNNHNDLYQTLKIFLRANQRIKESANILSLHTKTIRYRLDRITEVTSINFNNPDEVLRYNIGFRVLELNDLN